MTDSSHFAPLSAPYPPLSETLGMPEQPPTDLSTSPVVTYGEWEPDPDAPKALYYPSRAAERFVRWVLVGMRLSRGPILKTGDRRRKRFETWHDAEGREMGRWTWERRRGF